MSDARWFIGVLVVRSSVGTGAAANPTVDLQYRIIRARDSESAYIRALELGQATALSYRNSAGEAVQWEFAGIHDLQEVDAETLSDGTEVYSQRVRVDVNDLVLPKEKLSVFWAEANRNRTAQELLENE